MFVKLFVALWMLARLIGRQLKQVWAILSIPRTPEQMCYALYAVYVVHLKQAVILIEDPNVPTWFKRGIRRVFVAREPLVDQLLPERNH